MTNWCAVAKKLALSRGRIIDSKRAEIIKDELLADGKIDKEEFAFLMSLRREAQWVDKQLDDVILKAAKPVLLKSGFITPQDTIWLKATLLSDGRVNERERLFLSELLAASNQHSREFVAWCAGFGLEPAKPGAPPIAGAKAKNPTAAAPTEQPESAEQFGKEVSRLIQSTEGQVRWLRFAIIGLVLVMLLLGGTSAGMIWYKFGPGKPDGVERIVKSKEKQPAPEDHKFVKEEFNGKQIRGLDILVEDKSACAFRKAWPLDLRPGDNNEAVFVEENEFKHDRNVKMWLTVANKSPDQGPLPQIEVTADVNGMPLRFDELTPEKTQTNEIDAKFKKGTQNPIRLKIKLAGKKPYSVALQMNWRDDPKDVRLFVRGVGVSKYANHKLPDHNLNLRFADKDARDLVAALKNQPKAPNGLFQDIDDKVLENENATGNAILKEIKDLSTRARSHDLVVLIFAGHGKKHYTDEHFFFLPYDYDPSKELETTAVSWQYVKRYLNKMPCQVVVIMDACHAGAIDERGEARA